MAETLQPFCLGAHSLPSGSISFGRFETEPLSWERRSAFSCNNYLEEVERYSKPGSVNQRKAYFEVFFKRKGLQQPDSQCKNWTECQSSKGEYMGNSNHTDLHRESLFECDEESSNCHRDSEVIGKNTPMHENFSPGLRKSQGDSPKVRAESKTSSTIMKTSSASNVVARDSNKVSKEKISKSHTAKQPVKNISNFKPLLAKIPKSTESRESEKQKCQHARPQRVARSSTEKTTIPSAANINGDSRGKVKNKDEGKEARIKQMPGINNTKTAKMPAISPMGVPQDSSGEKTVPVHVETTKLGRKSTDPVRKVTSGESNSSSTSISIKLPGQPSPSKNKENNLASNHQLRGKQVDTKKRDLSPSQTVTMPSKVPKLQSESSSPSSVCRAPSASSTSSVKQLSSKHTDTTESPKKNNLPTKCVPEGHEVTAEKHDVDISKTVSRPTRLAKLQNKSLSPSPVRNAPGASSNSSIKQLSSQCTDSTESPMKNNSPTKCLSGRGEVKAKKHNLDTFQTVSKPTKLATVQSKSSTPSPVLKAPSASSTSSSTKQLSSQHTKRTDSPMKNKFPTTSLPGGKVVSAKKSDLDISQMVSKPTKLAKLKHKSSPSPVLKALSESSTSSLKQLSSEFTSRTESPVKNNLPTKCPPGGKKVSAPKHDLDSSHTVSRTTKSAKLQRKTSNPVVKAATVSSTSSAVGQFLPQPKKENDVPRKNNENKFPTTRPPEGIEVVAKNNHLDVSRSVSKPTQLAKLQRESSSPGPSRKAGSASLTSIGQHAPKTMKRSETPKKNKNESKQLGTKGYSENPSQCEAVSNKYSIFEGNSSSAAKGVVRLTAQTNPTKSVGRV